MQDRELFHLIGAYPIEDWRNENCGILTLFYETQYICGALQAGDDLDKVEWIPLKQFDTLVFADSHIRLAQELTTYLEKEKS